MREVTSRHGGCPVTSPPYACRCVFFPRSVLVRAARPPPAILRSCEQQCGKQRRAADGRLFADKFCHRRALLQQQQQRQAEVLQMQVLLSCGRCYRCCWCLETITKTTARALCSRFLSPSLSLFVRQRRAVTLDWFFFFFGINLKTHKTTTCQLASGKKLSYQKWTQIM